MWSEYRKLGVVYAILAGAGLLVAVLSVLALRTVVASKDLVIFGVAQDLVEFGRVGQGIDRKVIHSRAYLLSGDERFLDRMRAERGRALDALRRLDERQGTLDAELRAELRNAEAEHQKSMDDLLELRRSQGVSDVLLRRWEEETSPRYERLENALEAGVREQLARMEDARARSALAAGRAGKLTVGMLALLLPVLLGSAWSTSRTLGRLSTAEVRLARRANEQAAVAEFGRRALETHEFLPLAREAALTLARGSGAPWAAVFGPSSDARLKPAAAVGVDLADVEPATADEDWRSLPLAARLGAKSGLAVLITCPEGERVLLAALSPRKEDLGESKRDFARALANTLASALARARSEEKLRRSEEEARQVVEGAREYAIFLLTPEGRVATWNSGAQRLKLYTAAEIVGRPLETLYTPEDRAAGVPARVLRVAEQEGRVHTEGWRLRKDGTRFWADVTVTALKDVDGRLRGFVKVTRDATERREAEEALRRSAEELERRVAERTLQLEAFTYTVSHDLRAPLRAMDGFSQALIEEYGHCLGPTGLDYAQRVRESARRMDQLIKDLLDYSRVGGLDIHPERVELQGVVDAALQGCAEQLKESKAAMEVEGPLPAVRGHGVTLTQVAQNLLSNAAKFVAPGVAPRVRIRAERRGGAARLWVEDNGIGVPAAFHEKIFDVFERLHGPEYPGTGVGLAIVKRALERMGGKAGIESEPGRGSRFWIELPAAA